MSKYNMGWSQADGAWMIVEAECLEDAEAKFENGEFSLLKECKEENIADRELVAAIRSRADKNGVLEIPDDVAGGFVLSWTFRDDDDNAYRDELEALKVTDRGVEARWNGERGRHFWEPLSYIEDDDSFEPFIEELLECVKSMPPRRVLDAVGNFKVSLPLLARIIERVSDDDGFGQEPDDKIKFSIAPCDLSLNYFICKASLAGESNIIIYAPSVNAEAYVVNEIAYGTDGLAEDIREFLGNVRYEEDRLKGDEMVWMEHDELQKALDAWPDIKTEEGDIVAVSRKEIESLYKIKIR